MKISVFGMGYVGLVTAVSFAELGYEVIGCDIDADKVSLLQKGLVPVQEPDVIHFLQKNISNGRIRFSTPSDEVIHASDILFICLGTPSTESGAADMSAINTLLVKIARQLENSKLIVLKSTVPVGTARRLQDLMLKEIEKRAKKFELDIVSNPEFLREGYAWFDTLNPSRIVIGSDSPYATEKLLGIYSSFKGRHPFHIMDTPSAELSKLVSNAFLATKISFMNEISQLCEKVGADIEYIRQSLASDPRIGGEFINAGVGYGGACLPKDVRSLINIGIENNQPLKILQEVHNTNLTQRMRFFERFEKELGGFKGKKIAVWGTAFKPLVDDVRCGPALDFIIMAMQGGAEVSVFDPMAMKNTEEAVYRKLDSKCNKLILKESALEAAKNADAVVLLTEWSIFKNLDLAEVMANMKSPLFFDGRNIFDKTKMSQLGFRYFSVGRDTL